MKIYVAGPMTGHQDYNFPAFFEAAARLRKQGHEVISPAENDIAQGWVEARFDAQGGLLSATKRSEGAFDWATALAWDVEAIKTCDAVYFLPGWTTSRGAMREYETAMLYGLQILGAGAIDAVSPAVQQQPLVGLIGYAQAGKDTVGSILGYRRIAFADPLKALALECNPLVGSWPQALGLVTVIDGVGWEAAKAHTPGVREFLQNLGVGVRNVLGGDTWVQAAFAGFDPTQPTVFTDVRFDNEVAAIRERGGMIVRVTRVGLAPPNGHVSEQLVDRIDPDYEIRANEGDLDALAAQAKQLDTWLRAA